MSNKSSDFRDRLFNAEAMTPELRDAYRAGVDAIVYEHHTVRSRLPAVVLLVICAGAVTGEAYSLAAHRVTGPGQVVAAVTMLAACALVGAWIARDLWRGQSVRRESLKVAEVFYGAAGILTVVQLLRGMRAPSDPASTFGVLFVLVFLVVCAVWSIGNRIAAAELTAREQALRLECRLAELADRQSGK